MTPGGAEPARRAGARLLGTRGARLAGTGARLAGTGGARLTGTAARLTGTAGARLADLAGLGAPRITVEVRGGVPGAVVRLAPVVLVAVVAELVGAGPLTGTVLAVLAATSVVRPALPAVAGVVLVAGLALLTGPDLLAPPGTAGGASIGGAATTGPWGPVRLVAVLVVLDATLRLAGLAPHVSWTGRVERSVLTRLGRSVLGSQVVVLPMAGIALAVRATASGTGDGDVLRLVALLAVAGLLGLLVPRRRRTGGQP